MTLVCIGDEYGQLGNRLVRAAHVLAFCRERNFAFLDLPFAPYARHLTSSASSLALSCPRVPGPLAGRLHQRIAQYGPRLARQIVRTPGFGPRFARSVHEITLPAGARIDLSRADVAEEFRKFRIVILNGWYFRCYPLVKVHAEWLRTFLSLNIPHKEPTVREIGEARAAGHVVVGVHIRGGDYRTWRGGRFFYPLDFYSEQMREAARLLAPHGVVFFVTSNEPVDKLDTKGLDVIFANGDLVSDLAALSQCNMVFGPPSTFSLWGAFVGGAGLWHVMSANDRLSMDRFAEPTDLNWELEY